MVFTTCIMHWICFRLEFETKIAELEKNKMEQDAQRQSDKDQYEEKLSSMQIAEESSKREIQNLR